MADDVVRDIPEEMVEKAARELFGGPHYRTKVVGGDIVEYTVTWDEAEESGPYGRAVYRGQARRVLSAALAGRQVVDAPDDGHCSKCGQPFSPDVRAAIVDEPVEDLPDITVQHPTRGLIRWSWREVRWVQVAAGSGSGED